jgi:hypothetical protein
MISSKEFLKRARALEQKGLEITVIGRKPQPLRVMRERALERYMRRLILIHTGHRIGIAVSGVPRLKGSQMSLGLALEIPVGLGKPRLSKENKKLLEALSPSRHAHRTLPRRASTGS